MKKVFALFLMVTSISAYAQVELVSGGSANAYTLAFPGVFSYSNGISITFKSNFANTAAATINVNGLGTKDIRKEASASLAANDIKSGQVVTLVYDGTNFQMTSASGNASGGGGGSQTLSISNDTLSISGGNSVVLPGGASSGWNITGNAVDSTNFIGTTNAENLRFRAGGSNFMTLTQNGKLALNDGHDAVFIGDATGTGGGYWNGSVGIGINALTGYGESGQGSVAIGNGALQNFTTETNSAVAIGNLALNEMQNSFGMTAVGTFALQRNKGNSNTAVGYAALSTDTAGGGNVAIGTNALVSQQQADHNIAIGLSAMYFNVNGSQNIAIGADALAANTDQNSNIAIGYASQTGSTGNSNVTLGMNTLMDNTGDNNTVIGTGALQSPGAAFNNTVIGAGANAAPNLTNATAIGAGALVSQSNSMVLGSTGVNVGIGTGTPAQRLHVKGQVQIDTVFHATDADSILTISLGGVIRKRTAASLVGEAALWLVMLLELSAPIL
jgi:hypothetical protein